MENMNKRLAVLAVGMALITSFLVYFYLSQASDKDVVQQTKMVYVAKTEIPAKVVIQSDMVSQVAVPVDIAIPMGVTEAKEIIGKMTKERIVKGEAILAEHLYSNEKTTMAYVVPNGKRAVTIGVNEVAEVGDFITPGDYVDVIATYEEKDKDLGNKKIFYPKLTKVILQNIQVLGIGQNMEETKETAKALPVSVTLAVTLEEAEKLILSDESGVLRLALRPAFDNKIVNTNGYIRDDVQVPKARVELSK